MVSKKEEVRRILAMDPHGPRWERMEETKRRKKDMKGAYGVKLYKRLLAAQEARTELPDMNVHMRKYPT